MNLMRQKSFSKSLTPIQTIPIKVYVHIFRPKVTKPCTPHKFIASMYDEQYGSAFFDPLLTNANNFLNSSLSLNETSDSQNILSNISAGGLLGGFPVRLLVLITRLNKILAVKRDFIRKLNDMNCEAECIKAAQHNHHHKMYTKEFQINYATLIINIEKLNKDLSDYIKGAQTYCEQFAPDMKEFIEKFNINQTLQNNSMCRKSYEEANYIFVRLNKRNTEETGNTVQSVHITQLITQLTSLMLQIKEYSNTTADRDPTRAPHAQSYDGNNDSNNNNNSNDSDPKQLSYLNTQSISMTIDNIKKNYIYKTNCKLFEDKVEVHLNHIQSCLNNFNKFNPFKKFSSNNEKFLFKQD
jgi:hypothetical protein